MSFLRSICLLTLAVVASIASGQSAAPVRLRISVENTESHVQTQAVQEFAQRISELFGDDVRVEFYHSASLLRDNQVVPAIARGEIEMAVPGTWHLASYVPEIAHFLLPDFFGAGGRESDAFLETVAGRALVSRMERILQVTIPGHWMDLGPAHVFTTDRPIRSLDDFSDLRIRVAGGRANALRVEAFGATAVIISWPDLINALERRTVDGVLTTFETVRSASLWEHGIRYAWTDHEYFPQYVPLVSNRFWSRLSSGQQEVFRTVWNQVATEQRIAAARAQRRARREAEAAGVIVNEPSVEQQARARTLLMSERSRIISELGLDLSRLGVDGEER